MQTIDRLLQDHEGVGELEVVVSNVRKYFTKKLWFNISSELIDLFALSFLGGNELLEVYENFVRLFEDQLSDMVIARLILVVTRKLKDQILAEKFVDRVVERIEQVQKRIVFGTIILRTEKAMCVMRRPDLDEEQVKEILDHVDGIIVRKGYVDPFVNSYFFRVKSVFFKLTGQFNKFYSSSLLFLSYASVDDELSEEEQAQWAFDIGLAALVGDEVYNFGELLANPIIEKLRHSSSFGWLFQVLIVYNRGNMLDYLDQKAQFEKQFESVKILSLNSDFLKKKIQLMAVLELSFKKEVGERNLSFSEVAESTQCKMEEVEFILLKALALGLIKGIVDQVNKSIYVSWIQPRVLDMSQINVLRGKMKTWYDRIQVTQNRLRD